MSTLFWFSWKWKFAKWEVKGLYLKCKTINWWLGMLKLTFNDPDAVMLFYDLCDAVLWFMRGYYSDFRADPTRCCVVGGTLIVLQVGAEAWGGVSKAVQGLSPLSERPRSWFCAQRCLTLGFAGVWCSLGVVLASWTLLLWTTLLVHAKNSLKWPISGKNDKIQS